MFGLTDDVCWRRGERARIVENNAHVKGHDRPLANSYDSISSKGHLEYLLPPFLENREHVAKKQEGAPAPFFKHKTKCGSTVLSPDFLRITATLQVTSHHITI